MTLDYILLIISIFFVYRELFPKTDNFNPRAKKILYGFITGLFLILSIINVYDTNKETDKLINTAEDILSQTDDINQGLRENLDLIENTKTTLDSVKFSIIEQKTILDKTSKKSAELVELEAKSFIAKRPELIVTTEQTKISYDSVSQKNRLTYQIVNSGERTAYRVTVYDALFELKPNNTIKYISSSSISHFASIAYAYQVNDRTREVGISNDNFGNSKHRYLLVVKLLYFDEIAKTGRTKMYVFRTTGFNDNRKFGDGIPNDVKIITDYLNDRHEDFGSFLIENLRYSSDYPEYQFKELFD